ncbi:hypothetical protein [Labedaea rhizosphaerae]|uniref:Uncharacterized protein n=1 Tax=Labedaea rhizosphaerae TaxID=598644 RepID=A0A4R6SG47_LABRH|nr:hypothetical protein [Labedaea rhizosphaerae]TDP98185.1 hypothetical protein EV186_1031166 [Labedaea rhizosphaerae]
MAALGWVGLPRVFAAGGWVGLGAVAANTLATGGRWLRGVGGRVEGLRCEGSLRFAGGPGGG